MATTIRADAETDRGHMAAALSLAARGLGRTWPNPSVGCVIVDAAGHVAGRGHTQAGGRPHAETMALREAGDLAGGGTAYVSLEPCAHHGATPPCVDALVTAGIARCVVATGDPDPRVDCRGIAALKAAGITVTAGILGEAAAELNAGFFLLAREGRPLFTLKLATSLDGRIATSAGESRWITGPGARARGHQLRATHDAILVGSGTVLADDPELTCRLPGLPDRSPLRIVLDGRLRLGSGSKLVAGARSQPTWLLTLDCHEEAALRPFRAAGVEVVQLAPGAGGGLDLPSVARELGRRGLTRVLVEGGAATAASLLSADLADRIAWFTAPIVIGGSGVAGVDVLPAERLDRIGRFELLSQARTGPDGFALYRRARS